MPKDDLNEDDLDWIAKDFHLIPVEKMNLAVGFKVAKDGQGEAYINDLGTTCRLTKQKSDMAVDLVIEEDGSVRWMTQPDSSRGDVSIVSMNIDSCILDSTQMSIFANSR